MFHNRIDCRLDRGLLTRGLASNRRWIFVAVKVRIVSFFCFNSVLTERSSCSRFLFSSSLCLRQSFAIFNSIILEFVELVFVGAVVSVRAVDFVVRVSRSHETTFRFRSRFFGTGRSFSHTSWPLKDLPFAGVMNSTICFNDFSISSCLFLFGSSTSYSPRYQFCDFAHTFGFADELPGHFCGSSLRQPSISLLRLLEQLESPPSFHYINWSGE